MGSGKSTLGRLLARQIGSYFLDTDRLIETYYNLSIPEIFKQEGEEKFRELEREVVFWLEKSVTGTVIGAGGGLPIFVPEIKRVGVVVYLKVELEEILKRIDRKEREKRPLFQNFDRVVELYHRREPVYRQIADFIVPNQQLEDSLNRLAEIGLKMGIGKKGNGIEVAGGKG